MAVKDYNVDPDLNTTISGINIAEGCAPSGINNAIRQLMADVKTESAAQDEAISAAKSSADEKVSTVNGRTPDANGNVDVGGMPLGTVVPYTGKNVPAGTLRADGTTYTNMRSAFPEFYEWVVASGLTVPLADYALVEGSCGAYGLDTSTGTVRMPTLAAGVFGTTVAGQYGQAVQAGLPNINGSLEGYGDRTGFGSTVGAFYRQADQQRIPSLGDIVSGHRSALVAGFDASRSSPIYGRSNTVTPSHVKYPWVIVVYNAAVPSSVAQAGEFIELLSGKADKTQLASVVAPGFVMPFAANSNPQGYLLCNGAAVSRTTYAALFSAIGTTYGTGNGSTTFNLPNLTDKFIQGSGTAGTVKGAGLPNITGSLEDIRVRIGAHGENNGTGAFWSKAKTNSGDSSNGGQLSQEFFFDASRSNSIYGASTTVQPPAVTMRYYIKY